jgi:gamma-glutamyltranspeptidase/glutathione hydrolase
MARREPGRLLALVVLAALARPAAGADPAPAPTAGPAPVSAPGAKPASAPAPAPSAKPAPAPAPSEYEAAFGVGDELLTRLEERGVRADPYRAGRTPTLSRNGVVASPSVLASQAGLDALRRGGSAMDAAVATAAVLSVVEPMSSGLGGDAFFLYYEAKSGRVFGLNGSGRSPRGLSREHFAEKGLERVPESGWEAVTVPGAVDAWAEGLARFGRRPLAELLAPAIAYAEEGFPVTEIVSYHWKSHEEDLRRDPWSARHYLVDGRAPGLASVARLPALAGSLRQLAEGGRDAFYRGPIAAEIVRYARESGGFFSLEDFAAHRSTWVEPLHVDYRGSEVYQIPPNGQGIAVLMLLNVLEGLDLRALGFDTPQYLHTLIEAKKLVYADLAAYVADPEGAELPVEYLLSEEYAASRRARIDPERAAAEPLPAELPAGSDTVYLAAIDREGNACSFIQSVYDGFGSKVTGGATGIVLQNRGAGFSLERGHRNEYAPGKRPFHTIIPGMVLRQGRLHLAYGLMGGPMQPQGHVQLLLHHLDFGLGIQEAIDVPRWFHARGRVVLLEHGTPRATIEALRALGHEVHPAGLRYFGGAQAVGPHPETGVYLGASDPRKDGAALGY